MKKIINLALAATVAPLSSFSICASNSLLSNNDNMKDGDVYNITVNVPPYFPCKVSTDITQLVQVTDQPSDGIIHVYIEDDPTHEFYLEKIEITSGRLEPTDISNYFKVDRWEEHNSAFEITVDSNFYFDVYSGDIQITPTVKRSSFNVVNDNPDYTKIVSQQARMFNTYRAEIYPLNPTATVGHEVTITVGGTELTSDKYKWNIIDEGAYGILTIKANIMTSDNLSIYIPTSDQPVVGPKSLICRFEVGSSGALTLGTIPRCIIDEEDKFTIDLTNLCKSLPAFKWDVKKVYKLDDDEQTLIPLDDAIATFDCDTRQLHLDLSAYTSQPKTNIIIDFNNLKSAVPFATESWFDLDRWMSLAKEKGLNVLDCLKSIYDINDFLGQEKNVRWDNVDHKARIVAVNTTPLAANDDLETQPSSEKAMFTFEFENVLTQSNGEVVRHNWSNATPWYEPDWGYNCWCIGVKGSGKTPSGIYKYLHGSDFLDKLDPNLKPLLKYTACHRITYTTRDRGELCVESQFWLRSLFFIPTAVEVAGPADDFYFSEHSGGWQEPDWAEVHINKWYDNQVEGTTSGKLDVRVKTSVFGSTACEYWICSPSESGSGEARDEDTVYAKTDGSLDHKDMDNQCCIAPWFCI